MTLKHLAAQNIAADILQQSFPFLCEFGPGGLHASQTFSGALFQADHSSTHKTVNLQ